MARSRDRRLNMEIRLVGCKRTDEGCHFFPGSLALEFGLREKHANLFADCGECFHFFPGEDVRPAMLDVDDTDHFVAGDDGSGEKSIVLIFRKLGESFEAGIEKGFFADRNQTAFASNPAGETFVHAKPKIAENAGSGIIR